MSSYESSRTQRLESLRELQSRLRSANLREDSAFQSLLRDAKILLEISDTAMGDALGVSRPTISRWLAGKNLPYNATRRHTAGWIDQQLSSRIKQVDRRDVVAAGGSMGSGRMIARGGSY